MDRQAEPVTRVFPARVRMFLLQALDSVSDAPDPDADVLGDEALLDRVARRCTNAETLCPDMHGETFHRYLGELVDAMRDGAGRAAMFSVITSEGPPELSFFDSLSDWAEANGRWALFTELELAQAHAARKRDGPAQQPTFDALSQARYTIVQGAAPDHPQGTERHGRYWWIWGGEDNVLAEEAQLHFGTEEDARADAVQDLIAQRWDEAAGVLGLDTSFGYSEEEKAHFLEQMLRGEWVADRQAAVLEQIVQAADGSLLEQASRRLTAAGYGDLARSIDKLLVPLREAAQFARNQQPPRPEPASTALECCRPAA